MMKKKKQSRSQSSTKKTLEPSPDSSPSPRLLSIFRSKLVSGKDLKHMLGMRTKTAPGLSSQSRIVRCPKCHKLLQEPIDATIYKCSGCNSILQAKRWELESNGKSIPEALLYSQNRSLSIQLESAEGGSKTPMRNTHREYNSSSRASPSVERGYHSETVYKHETSDVRREWMRKADEFSDSDAFASARSSPYNSRSSASEWTQHERRYEETPRVPFYPASPSPSSAYEYGYSSPFRGSQASASEQSYYHHHQPDQFKQDRRAGWFQESSAAPGETSDGKYYHSYSQSQHDPWYHNLYGPSSSAASHRSVYSERSYQEPLRSTYSEHSKSEKSSQRDKKKYVKKRKPVVKRYVFPSAGGAPFVACSYCLELLQLPQVSLHGKHQRYQVRCGNCSGVLKFSVGEKADSHQDSHSLAEETVTNHQDPASEGREEVYPEDNHLSSSDKGSGDRTCKSKDDVILGRNMETFEDKETKEDIRSISSTFLDSTLEVLQPQWEPSMNQPASSESIGDISRNHLEQSEEARSDKSTEMDNNISERVSCDSEEAGYEKDEILKPEGSDESLEVPVCKNERISDSSVEGETVVDIPVSHSGKSNEYVCETRVLSENTRDTQEFDWEETQGNEENGGERRWEDIMGDKPGLILEKSLYIGDSICDSGSSNGEIYEDTTIKEDTSHTSAAPQNENQMLIEHPDQSGEATVSTSRIHEEESKYEYENLSERQDLDKTISDRVGSELESRCETNEALDTDKVSEDGSFVSLTKASETFNTSIEGERGEESLVSHQMDSPNENVENSYERLVYAAERTWEETMEDRAGLHLEVYESNYENYKDAKLDQSQYEYGIPSERPELSNTIVEPEEDASGRLDSTSRGSFSDHESSEDSDVFQESQDAKADQSKYGYETPSERQELSNTVSDTVRHEIQEYRYEKNETFEQAKMVGDGSVVSLEKASETNIGETGEERSVSHQMKPQNESREISYGTVEQVYLEGSGYASERICAEAMGDGAGLHLEEYHNNPHQWTSERAPTFRLHEYELGTMSASEEDVNGRSSSSTDFTNGHESSEEKAVANEEPSLVDESKIEELNVTLMVENGPSLHLEKCGNDSTKLEETFEWTERGPTFLLRESELGTMLEPDEYADGRSESSSMGSFNNHDSSESRAVFHEEEQKPQLREMTKDRVSLDLEKGENESIKLEETFEWSSERALTFQLHDSELETRLTQNEDADGRSESSSRGSFNDHVISKEREMEHEEEPRLVNDSRTKWKQVDEVTEDTVLLHLECENESMKLDETFEWTSGRSLTFRRHEYELGTMLEPAEDASESSLRGFFSDHGASKERAVIHDDESWLVDDCESVIADNGTSLNLEKCENEKVVLDNTLEPRDDSFRLSLINTLEQEMKPFHLEMSEEKQVNLGQTFIQGDTEENIPASESHESPRKMAEVDSEAEEDILGDHLQKEKEKSGLTSEPYSHLYNTTDPSEIVGLRLALYETQTSPLRSPFSSPIHTPTGSPLHVLMRSPIASPMHSHIVSPMRSPINSSGSLSDVLFFGKKA